MSVAQVITDACKNAQYEASKLAQDTERSNSVNDKTIIEAVSSVAGMTVNELLDDIVVHGFGEL